MDVGLDIAERLKLWHELSVKTVSYFGAKPDLQVTGEICVILHLIIKKYFPVHIFIRAWNEESLMNH